MIKRRDLYFLMFGILVLACFAVSGTAKANGGPHGGFTATTDGCAGCHRAHTSSGPRLLIATTTYQLCMTCHGTTGTGADTNVQDGYFLSSRSISTVGTALTADNSPLLGGGFANYKGLPTTSSHEMTGANNSRLAWGNGATPVRGTAVAISDTTFSCASCHDPHGSPNYRILKTTINGVSNISVAQVDEAAKDYDTENWGNNQSTVCAACHVAYHQTAANQGSTLNGGTYTHRVDMSYTYANTPSAQVNPETVGFGGQKLPLANTGTTNLVVCQTCHIPHGTSAQMTGIANGGPIAGGTLPGNTTSTDSALLRLDNRAVCEACHQK